jgi:hypothetical protein
MIESLHFHRGYSLRLHKSKPFINYGIIRILSRVVCWVVEEAESIVDQNSMLIRLSATRVLS